MNQATSGEDPTQKMEPNHPEKGNFELSPAKLGFWIAGFVALASGLQQLLSSWVTDFGGSPHINSAFSFSIAATIPAVVITAALTDAAKRTHTIQRIVWGAWLLPMIVFTSLVLFGGEDAPITPVPEISNQEQQNGGSNQDELGDNRPAKAAISIDLHTLASKGQNVGELSYLGFGIQHLLDSAFDQYPEIESGAPIQASILKGKGIASPNDVTLPLYQEISISRRSDLMLTGEIEVIDENQLSISLTLHQVSPLESLWRKTLLTSESEMFTMLEQVAVEIAQVVEENSGRTMAAISQIPIANFGSNIPEAFGAFSESLFLRNWKQQKVSAIALLRKAIEIDPRFSYAWWNLAAYLDSSTDAAEIESALRNALKFDDRLSLEDAYYIRLTYYNFRRPDNETRLELLKKFKEEFPFNTRPRELLADYYANARLLDESIHELDELIDYLPSDNPSAHHSKGHVLQMQKKYDLAAAMFTHVAGLMPEEPKSWFDLAYTYQFALRFDEAEQSFQRMLKAGDGGESPFYLRKYYDFLMCQGETSEAFKILEEMELWSDGEREQIELASARADFYATTGQLENLQNQIEIIRTIEKSRLEDEREKAVYSARTSLVDARIDIRLGRLLQAEQRLIAARSLLNSEVNLGTRRLEYDLSLEALEKNESLKEINAEGALAELTAFLVSRNPNFDKHDRMMFEAAYLQKTGKANEAELRLLSLLELNPGDADHFINLAEIAIDQRQPSKALNYLNQGPAWCPYRTGPMLVEAEARIDMENYDLANAMIVKVEKLLANADKSIAEVKQLNRLKARLRTGDETQL